MRGISRVVAICCWSLAACSVSDGGLVDKEVAGEIASADQRAVADVPISPPLDSSSNDDEGIFTGLDWGQPEVVLGCQQGEGCFLDKCDDNSQCQSGWCVENMGEGVCSQLCQDECPPGWSCQHVAGSDPDVLYICVPNYVNLCRPCSTGNDCKSLVGTEDVCLDYGSEGSFCGGACGQTEECPWGFSCHEALTVDGISTKQCVADTGACPCTGKSIGLSLWTPCETTSPWGNCAGKRVCTEAGLSPCDAPEPTQEECNGLDDNCNGEIDEDTCDDENLCTEDLCQGEAGCSHEPQSGLECIDGDICTTADHCEEGVCVGSPVICDDKNPCTDDLCTPAGGCDQTPNKEECDDGDPCTVADQCEAGACLGFAVDCDCQTDGDCVAFEDGDLCNGTLVCDTASFPHKCVTDPATVVTCPEPQGQEGICLKAKCDPTNGACSLDPDHEGYACSTGNKCVVGQECQQGSCIGGVALNCSDGNECSEDSCDPAAGCGHAPIAGPCTDGNICTSNDYCQDGECVPGDALDCADDNPCTADTCSSATGCVHTPTIEPGASCCLSPADCPSEFSFPLKCNDIETCQGDSLTAICQDNQCGSVVVQDDSACNGLANSCGLFSNIVCTGQVVQVPQACPLSCTQNADCDALAYCDGVCKSDVPNGGPCVADDQCESGNCNPAPNGVDWFCNAAIHECAMDDGAGVNDGYSYCYAGDVFTCAEADSWASAECADECGFYLPVDECEGAKCSSCPGFCGSDDDCDANAHCDGICVEDLSSGLACDEDSDCISGNCGAAPDGNDFCISAKDDCALDDGDGVDAGYSLCLGGDRWSCAGDDLWTSDDCADECGLFQAVDACIEGECQECPVECIDDAACDPGSHCDAVCVADEPAGAVCDEDSDCVTAHCSGGFCCADGDCCVSAANCPAGYTEPADCNEVSSCQGFRIDATCTDFICSSNLVEDDSACTDGLEADPCGPYLATHCTGELEQQAPACAEACAGDEECDEGFHCDDDTCVSDLVLGSDCDENSDCANDLCHNGRCCQEACTTEGCFTGQCGDDGACTSHTSGHQNCAACEACDETGQCAAQTATAAAATALGCAAGDEGCRRCDAGSCTYFTSAQQSCPSNHSCTAQGSCQENLPVYKDICFGNYPQNKNVSAYCPAGYSHHYHVCGASSISNYSWGPYYEDKYLSQGGHCSCCCNCNSVCVRCKKN